MRVEGHGHDALARLVGMPRHPLLPDGVYEPPPAVRSGFGHAVRRILREVAQLGRGAPGGIVIGIDGVRKRQKRLMRERPIRSPDRQPELLARPPVPGEQVEETQSYESPEGDGGDGDVGVGEITSAGAPFADRQYGPLSPCGGTKPEQDSPYEPDGQGKRHQIDHDGEPSPLRKAG